jgi:hypothetical protein
MLHILVVAFSFKSWPWIFKQDDWVISISESACYLLGETWLKSSGGHGARVSCILKGARSRSGSPQVKSSPSTCMPDSVW